MFDLLQFLTALQDIAKRRLENGLLVSSKKCYIFVMTKALLEKSVKELTTKQLADLYEERLIDEAGASLDRGERIKVSREWFENKRQALKKQLVDK